jgi:hypothetical protein
MAGMIIGPVCLQIPEVYVAMIQPSSCESRSKTSASGCAGVN